MSKRYEDWADWAGDRPEQAESQLRDHSHDFTVGGANCWTCGEPKDCPHAEVDTQGVCENCGIEVPGWEPDDAQLLTQTGTKEPVA